MNNNRGRHVFFCVAFIVGGLLLFSMFDTRKIVTSPVKTEMRVNDPPANERSVLEFNKVLVKTSRGMVTFSELGEKPFGYEMTRYTVPVPVLKQIKPQTCDEVFDGWLRIAAQAQPSKPPKHISEEDIDEFLLNGYTSVNYQYSDDRDAPGGEKPRGWENMTKFMNRSPLQSANVAYGSDGLSVHHAMSHYGLRGMKGFVVGSMQPWVETYALQNGAKHVLTVEYNKLEIDPAFRDRMTHIFPVDFCKERQKFVGTYDFAVTFSSIEHSGLGRYGDPIDPIGDLREMQKIHCMLKPGGILFLGIPQGADHIVYNLHRIYGPLRLALMFAGFNWVSTFSGTSKHPLNVTMETLRTQTGMFVQRTFVLRKI